MTGSWNARSPGPKKIKQGHPLDATTMIGAQASNDQLEKILSYFDIGKQEGAKVLTGGKRAQLAGEIAEGYYVEPTIFEGNNKMLVFQEEIFGPVVSVLSFRTQAEAIEKANNSRYGLAAGIWTDKGAKAFEVANALRAGVVWQNTYNHFDPTAAFGGYKESGWGREMGKEVLELYTETKAVAAAL